MAVTVEAGKSVLMKGTWTDIWGMVSVNGSSMAQLINKTVSDAEAGGSGIIWKGELAATPANPQLNWA